MKQTGMPKHLLMLRLIVILLRVAKHEIFSNSAAKSTSQHYRTRRLTSSACLQIIFMGDSILKSVFIIMYKIGPTPEPWITWHAIHRTEEQIPLTAHFCLHPMKKATIQLRTINCQGGLMQIFYIPAARLYNHWLIITYSEWT